MGGQRSSGGQARWDIPTTGIFPVTVGGTRQNYRKSQSGLARDCEHPELYLIGMCAKSLQSHSILCNPTECSPPGSSVHGILQTRTLGWLPFPSPGDLPDPGIEPRSPALQADSLPTEPPGLFLI